MSLHIGIDARAMDNSTKTGLGTYTSELISNLAKHDQVNHYFLYYSSLRRKSSLMPGPDRHNVSKIVAPIPYINHKLLTTLWRNVFLPAHLRRRNIHVYHSTFSLNLPSSKNTKVILTIPDIAYLQLDHEFVSLSRPQLHQHYEKGLRKADFCIAISHYTKNEILNHFNIDPERIRVIYLGVNDKFKQLNNNSLINNFIGKNNLPKRFILTVGSSMRKNTHGLIKAFHLLRKSSNIDHKLVIVGKVGKWNSHIPVLIEELGLANEVMFLGYFPSKELPLLYNAAQLFVYPSLYEGFGIPPLEAMRCGTPVVVSNTTSLPEVVGPAGTMVDPNDHEALAAAIEQVLKDQELYESLRQKGFKQAAKFSWEKTALETLDVYRQVVSQ